MYSGISLLQMNLKIDIKPGLWGQGKTIGVSGIFV
jgi:hypothetical protein